jgi:membrane peptidoglycan carboxypeptidase
MAARVQVLRVPSFRRLLIGIHRDLFVIDKHALDYVPNDPLSIAEKMVLILEDRRYFDHPGIDVIACGRELWRALTARRYGGASTIAMQFVRTATGYKERTLGRKFYEMVLAIIIQFRYSKPEILRSYLASAFFGSGIFGIERASQDQYQKRSSELTLSEAAFIAAMLVYPKPLVPTSLWLSKINRRTNYAVRLYPSLEKRYEKLPGWEEF